VLHADTAVEPVLRWYVTVLRRAGQCDVPGLSRAAKKEILPGVEHRQHKRLNNRAENLHQPTRLREKKMRKFKSAGHAQRFLSAFGPICGHFCPRRHHLSAGEHRATLQRRFQVWSEVTGLKRVG
jgi:putative transposase